MPQSEDIRAEEIKAELSRFQCIQCDRCTASCPVHEIDVTYSPRKSILTFFQQGANGYMKSHDLWQCLTCLSCREVCPSHTVFGEYMRELRARARGQGVDDRCKHGMILRSLQRLQSSIEAPQARTGWCEEGTVAASGEYMLFVGCAPLFDHVFEHTSSLETSRAAVKLLNACGVKPVVSDREKCCGHDLLWAGDRESFDRLRKHNLELFGDLGVKHIITPCAECYATLSQFYPGVEVEHLTQFMAARLEEGKLAFAGEGPERRVTLQDPCRLGRQERVFEAPRRVLESLPGVTLVEMDHVRADSHCCGVGAFANCDEHTKFLQHRRLKEAAESGAEVLATACPKCRLHFNCYLDGQPVEEMTGLTVTDVAALAAEYL